mmetsp:Transcript_15131/g.30204  ORF Transcript_15131/g.30204 Transcript_15131/m.30204 type:complete len:429 (+) Transcript_15131:58-1344(+)|eukprot:CAMPEP_0194325042 /NCGR_PEP_ID=MMETSP0171-20130528/29007_1 /TAXON_ID=218684 /ORGANISM="Corethron pennatum, Strain L29A3" /LENGTH=428 /DNA_ID=CAMNT_0039084059 /DNA_START=26 /DNA_END=1312 /DNA_ORIENTATION=+
MSLKSNGEDPSKDCTPLTHQAPFKANKDQRAHPLLHVAVTDLRHAAREVRRYEIQRITKRIRFLESSSTSPSSKLNNIDEEDGGNGTVMQKILRAASKRKRKLASLRLELEMLSSSVSSSAFVGCTVVFGCRSLGLEPYTGLSGLECIEKLLEDALGGCGENGKDKLLKDLIEKSLNHPKLKAVSAALDDAITDYRRYKVRWEDIRQERSVEKAAEGAVPERWIDGAEDVDGTNEKISFHHWKNRRKKRLRASSVDGVEGASRTQCKAGRDDNHAGASGVFVDSLGGNKVVANKMAQYGPAAMEVGGFRVEKNRMGQRARKAKAMAMEAASQGKKWDSSHNWRDKKDKNDCSTNHLEHSIEKDVAPKRQKTTSGLDPSIGSVTASDVANMGKEWKETGKAHPSWAARELAKKHKITIGGTPQGKKTIF